MKSTFMANAGNVTRNGISWTLKARLLDVWLQELQKSSAARINRPLHHMLIRVISS